MLLEEGAEPNSIESPALVSLAWALGSLDFKKNVLNLLLKYGADPNIRISAGRTAIHFPNESIIELLIESGDPI